MSDYNITEKEFIEEVERQGYDGKQYWDDLTDEEKENLNYIWDDFASRHKGSIFDKPNKKHALKVVKYLKEFAKNKYSEYATSLKEDKLYAKIMSSKDVRTPEENAFIEEYNAKNRRLLTDDKPKDWSDEDWEENVRCRKRNIVEFYGMGKSDTNGSYDPKKAIGPLTEQEETQLKILTKLKDKLIPYDENNRGLGPAPEKLTVKEHAMLRAVGIKPVPIAEAQAKVKAKYKLLYAKKMFNKELNKAGEKDFEALYDYCMDYFSYLGIDFCMTVVELTPYLKNLGVQIILVEGKDAAGSYSYEDKVIKISKDQMLRMVLSGNIADALDTLFHEFTHHMQEDYINPEEQLDHDLCHDKVHNRHAGFENNKIYDTIPLVYAYCKEKGIPLPKVFAVLGNKNLEKLSDEQKNEILKTLDAGRYYGWEHEKNARQGGLVQTGRFLAKYAPLTKDSSTIDKLRDDLIYHSKYCHENEQSHQTKYVDIYEDWINWIKTHRKELMEYSEANADKTTSKEKQNSDGYLLAQRENDFVIERYSPERLTRAVAYTFMVERCKDLPEFYLKISKFPISNIAEMLNNLIGQRNIVEGTDPISKVLVTEEMNNTDYIGFAREIISQYARLNGMSAEQFRMKLGEEVFKTPKKYSALIEELVMNEDYENVHLSNSKKDFEKHVKNERIAESRIFNVDGKIDENNSIYLQIVKMTPREFQETIYPILIRRQTKIRFNKERQSILKMDNEKNKKVNINDCYDRHNVKTDNINEDARMRVALTLINGMKGVKKGKKWLNSHACEFTDGIVAEAINKYGNQILELDDGVTV